MASREGTPLSSVGSAEESDHESVKQDSRAQSPIASNLPPSKRRRTGVASWDRHTPLSSVQDETIPPPSPTASISSDTSGDVPNSPNLLGLLGNNQDDDYTGQTTDQVTVCRWDGCSVGDLGNMDGLVQHLHTEHIGSRQKRYSCEWTDCSRKGQTHASAYALRAHMRSHTREKPFYCTLPECDRNFTRSDALTKHMRSVHETDTLRPSDNKTTSGALGSVAGTPASKFQRIRLKLTGPKDIISEADHSGDSTVSAPLLPESDLDDNTMPEFGPELGFDEDELKLPPRELYRLLRRQIRWAEKESTELRAQWDIIRPLRENAWHEKEAIFDDLIHAELALFSTFVNATGAGGQAMAPPANLTSDLEKLQHQQQRFKTQQDQLRAKAEEPADADVDAAE
ncbi:Zinc finger C2H2 [Penicillium argentinense]|uniref:Zinc finger C2H2 n=1 Tax=Penicillium argentinense TaxID=1131581 RepID=A0A9W9FF31_9EURO|nr:Zinc finger C2H2 [Penicillium argentinense]KAJ5098914.1 Zinc finger C2H2 [Penicillium argentinense]